MKDIVRESLVVCPKCQGDCYIDGWLCHKCNGKGKVDWISLAVEKNVSYMSALDNVNVARLIQYIRKSLSNNIENTIFNRDSLNKCMHQTMDTFKSSKAIYDYSIISTPDFLSHTIFLKPSKAVQTIQLDFKITND